MINLSVRLILTRLVIAIAALTIYTGTILGQTANGTGSSSATEEQSASTTTTKRPSSSAATTALIPREIGEHLTV